MGRAVRDDSSRLEQDAGERPAHGRSCKFLNPEPRICRRCGFSDRVELGSDRPRCEERGT